MDMPKLTCEKNHIAVSDATVITFANTVSEQAQSN